MVLKRLTITVINIFFPPLAILLLCGPETDLVINCVLFLLAIIPSHIHAFYISCTYFNRKRKVRKGVYPGDWRSGIYSLRVQNGGASREEVERLRNGRGRGGDDDSEFEREEKMVKEERRRRRRREERGGGKGGIDVEEVGGRRERNANRSSRRRQEYSGDE